MSTLGATVVSLDIAKIKRLFDYSKFLPKKFRNSRFTRLVKVVFYIYR